MLDRVRWTSLAVLLQGRLLRGDELGVLMDDDPVVWIVPDPDGTFSKWIEYVDARPLRVDLVLPDPNGSPGAGGASYRRVLTLR